MNNNTAYQWQLRKMLLMETVGERLYSVMSSKTKDRDLKTIYQRLADNEAQTAKYIEGEISLANKNDLTIFNDVIANFASFVFIVLTVNQSIWLLKNTLKKRIYKRWYSVYKSNNRDLWNLLLKHEEFQYKLLRL